MYHGGKNRQLKQVHGTAARNHLPVFYKTRLGPTVREAVLSALEQDPDDQLNILEEVALLRSYASQFVGVYSAAVEQHLADSTDKNWRVMIEAGQLMTVALETVSKACEKAAKIASIQKDRFSIHDLRHAVDKILIMHHDVVGKHHPELARQFEQHLSEHLQITSLSQHEVGSTLTADQTIREFDASVPYFEEDEDE